MAEDIRGTSRQDGLPSAVAAGRKKVLFLNEGLYPCMTGGIEIFHYYFIKAFSRHYGAVVMTKCDKSLNMPNVVEIHTRSPFGRMGTVFMVLRHIKQIIASRNDIGLIHIPYSSAQVFQFYHVMLLARLLGIPYVLRIHGGGMRAARPEFMHAMYFNSASGVITVSQPVKEEYERRYGKEIKLIPSYLPFLQSSLSKLELRKKLGITHDSLVFLTVGTVKKIKGTDVLLEAVHNLGVEYLSARNVLFLVAGGGDLEAELRLKAERMGLGTVIRFDGRIPYEDVHEYYQAADVFVTPSLMEARPLALAEAHYNGMPAIGSDIPTISNTIENEVNGLLAVPGDVRSLVDALRNMIESRDLRERCRQNGIISRNDFNQFDAMVMEYTDYYSHIMANT